MKKATLIKELVNRYHVIQNTLQDQLQEINADVEHSTSWKAVKKNEAMDKAQTRILQVYDDIEMALIGLNELRDKQFAFDYSDPKLLGAVQFIKTNGRHLPESAWKQMIQDYRNKPAVLFYLSDLFGKSELVDAAIAAKDAANTISFSANLPQRISDSMYYITHAADPTGYVDTSGIMRELDALEAYETRISEDIGTAEESEGE